MVRSRGRGIRVLPSLFPWKLALITTVLKINLQSSQLEMRFCQYDLQKSRIYARWSTIQISRPQKNAWPNKSELPNIFNLNISISIG